MIKSRNVNIFLILVNIIRLSKLYYFRHSRTKILAKFHFLNISIWKLSILDMTIFSIWWLFFCMCCVVFYPIILHFGNYQKSLIWSNMLYMLNSPLLVTCQHWYSTVKRTNHLFHFNNVFLVIQQGLW